MLLAAELFESDDFEESAAIYTEYLTQYPHATAAREGRDRAEAAMAAVAAMERAEDDEDSSTLKERTARRLQKLKNKVKGVFKKD